MKAVKVGFVLLFGVSGLLLTMVAASAQSMVLGTVDVIHDRCVANCFGLEGSDQIVACAMGCDNAAAMTLPDDKVTLSSEEYVARWGNLLATKAGACHSTTACPAEYGSCGTWSSYSDCGDPWCGVWRLCDCYLGPAGSPSPNMPICDPGFGDALRQFRESYRVCFNASGQPCTEYQRTSVVLGCGCF